MATELLNKVDRLIKTIIQTFQINITTVEVDKEVSCFNLTLIYLYSAYTVMHTFSTCSVVVYTMCGGDGHTD